jgi:hypothetical protein
MPSSEYWELMREFSVNGGGSEAASLPSLLTDAECGRSRVGKESMISSRENEVVFASG